MQKHTEDLKFFISNTNSAIRQMSYGGVAVVWLLKDEVKNHSQLSNCATVAFILFSFSILFDLAYFYIGAKITGKESSPSKNHQRFMSEFLSLRISWVLVGYIFLMVECATKLWLSSSFLPYMFVAILMTILISRTL